MKINEHNRPLLMVRYRIHPDYEDKFLEWYESYMARFMERVPEMVSGRRVMTERNGIREYFSIYEIESPDKTESALKNIMQDTEERIKDSAEWHDWVEIALSECEDNVYEQIQLIER